MKAAYIKFDKYGHEYEYAYMIPSYLEGDVQAGSKVVVDSPCGGLKLVDVTRVEKVSLNTPAKYLVDVVKLNRYKEMETNLNQAKDVQEILDKVENYCNKYKNVVGSVRVHREYNTTDINPETTLTISIEDVYTPTEVLSTLYDKCYNLKKNDSGGISCL